MSDGMDISAFLRSLQPGSELHQRVQDAAAKAAQEFAEHVIGQAQQLAPQSPSNEMMPSHHVTQGVNKKGEPITVRPMIKNPRFTGHSGRLRDSATIEPAEVRGDVITVVAGFNVEYAAVQHERLDYVHTNGQAKYLETPLRENAGKFGEFVLKRMKEALEE